MLARPWKLQQLSGNAAPSSNVALFDDADQVVANERDAANKYWYTWLPLWGYTSSVANAPVEVQATQGNHQGGSKLSAVHFAKPAKISTQGMYEDATNYFNTTYQKKKNNGLSTNLNMTGINNVAYADGSVRQVEVTVDCVDFTPLPDTAIDPRLAP